jgi:P-type Cu2+ transporter
MSNPASTKGLATDCYHCGLPVPAGVNYFVLIGGSEQPMCCPGCQAVASTIISTGLDQYYQYRTDLAITPKALEEELLDELALYDRSDIQQDFVTQLEHQQAEAIFLVEGITCAACTWLIEHQLNKLAGVEQSSVNLSNHQLRIQWHTEQTKLSELLAAVYSIGYKAYPYQSAAEDKLQKTENSNYIKRLGIAGAGMAQVMMYAAALYAGAFDYISGEHRDFLRWVSLLIATPVVFYSARPFFSAALRNLKNRHLSMDVPVSIAILAAYFASLGSTLLGGREVYFDSVCMFTFFLLLGRFLEFRARSRMDQSSHHLTRLLPDTATLIEQGKQRLVAIRDLKPGDSILVKTAQIIPADGLVIGGQSSTDESHLNGEFIPVAKALGDTVVAGSINVEHPLTIEITEVGQNTKLSGILRLLDQARATKPPIAQLADKIAQYFIATVLILATGVALAWTFIDPSHAFWITLSVLVVTCPCALSLATPTALTAATGSLQKLGLLVSRGHTLEGLASINHVIFDKTGTLTTGKLRLQQIHPLGEYHRHQCNHIAAALEAHSEHPIANAFEVSPLQAFEPRVHPGQGIEGVIDGLSYRIGRPDFAFSGIRLSPPENSNAQAQWLLLANDTAPMAWFQLDDELRADAAQTVEQLGMLGLKVELLSGDYSNNVANVAKQLNISNYRSGASPMNKMTYTQALQTDGAKILMVGDGINDIPVLAAADVSIAMTSAADLTKANADAILLSSQLSHLVTAIRHARKTHRVIHQNLGWALAYNLIALPAAALGYIPPYFAALGMSLSSLVVVMNALRLSKPLTNVMTSEPPKPQPASI